VPYSLGQTNNQSKYNKHLDLYSNKTAAATKGSKNIRNIIRLTLKNYLLQIERKKMADEEK
jgi:hypothetical protein